MAVGTLSEKVVLNDLVRNLTVSIAHPSVVSRGDHPQWVPGGRLVMRWYLLVTRVRKALGKPKVQ